MLVSTSATACGLCAKYSKILSQISLKFDTRICSGKAGVIVIHCAIFAAMAVAGIKLAGVPQLKSIAGFSINFQGMFTLRGSRAIRV